ncbi:MAG: DNA methylase N-4, partial [Clostridium lundense]|nr:DNA methylase N-4 [Clostridium lundense]
MAISAENGFEVSDDELTPSLFPHVKDTVKWAVKGGQRAIFSSFGMQKTVTQLEILRIIAIHENGKCLVVCPRRVVVEFEEQAQKHLHLPVKYVRTMQEVKEFENDYDIFITNYERVRDGEDGVRIDPNYFVATSLDEASVLRGYGTKTYQEFLPLFKDVKYKFVATATPSPNRYKELIHYAGYLGVMDTGQALTRFFQRDSTKANNLTLYPNKETEFWYWVSTWALFLTRPSDLGYPDTGYDLPPLNTHIEVVNVDNETAGYYEDGEKKMFREAALGLKEAAKERRDNIPNKVERIVEILNRPENKDDHFIIWHDLEAERDAICKAIPGCKAVYGSQNDDEADKIVADFKDGRLKYLAAKPVMLGEGLNFQYHCHKAILLISYKFNDGA